MNKQAFHQPVAGVILTMVALIALPFPAVAETDDLLFLTKPAVDWQQDGTGFVRETICSHPDQVIVSRLTASAKGKYSGRIRLDGGREEQTSVSTRSLTFTGTLDNGMDYEAQVLVAFDGGSLKPDGDTLVFSGCDSVTITLAAGTSYVMDYAKDWKGENPHALVTKQAEAAVGDAAR